MEQFVAQRLTRERPEQAWIWRISRVDAAAIYGAGRPVTVADRPVDKDGLGRRPSRLGPASDSR